MITFEERRRRELGLHRNRLETGFLSSTIRAPLVQSPRVEGWVRREGPVIPRVWGSGTVTLSASRNPSGWFRPDGPILGRLAAKHSGVDRFMAMCEVTKDCCHGAIEAGIQTYRIEPSTAQQPGRWESDDKPRMTVWVRPQADVSTPTTTVAWTRHEQMPGLLDRSPSPWDNPGRPSQQ
jgi:hypothetical protein